VSIYRVIDKLEVYVREGTWLPFGMRILSEEKLFEFIEKMRSTLPEEVGRAKLIATNKERVIRDAQEKAQQIVSEAATQQAVLVDQTDILKQARATAEIVLREAEEKARKIRAGADGYAAQVLGELETRLATALGSVKKGQDAIAGSSAAANAAAAARAGAQAPVPAAVTTTSTVKGRRAAFDAATTPVEDAAVEAPL